MKRFLTLLLVIGTTFALPPVIRAVRADGEPASSSGDIRFVFDTSSFRGSNAASREELFLLIPNRELKFVNRGNGRLEADIDVRVLFRRWPTGEVLLYKTINAVLETPSSEAARGIHDLEVLQKQFFIEPGPFEVEVTVADRNTRGFGFFHLFGRSPTEGTASGRFVARRFAPEGLQLSDLLFARGTGKSISDVVPNPNRLYGAMLPSLSYYYEAYDPPADGGDSPGELFVRHEIVGGDGTVYLREDRILSPLAEGKGYRNRMNHDLRSLPGGAYTLRITARPQTRSDSVIVEAPFHVVWRKSDISALEDGSAAGDELFTEMNLDDEIASLRYILVPDDLSHLKGLPREKQKEWIEAYWKEKDPTPGTEANELRMEHYRRIQHANQRFTAMRQKGMDTDRGQIYIRYGEPDEISSGYSAQSFITPLGGRSHLSDQADVTGSLGGFNVEEKAYEIWTYSERGRFLGERRNRGAGLELRFVFVDVEGWGDYTLIQSTDPTEF